MGYEHTISYEDLTPDFSGRKSDAVMKQIADYVSEDIKKNIRHQREFDGVSFRPLSATRIAQKKKSGSRFSTKALMDTGKLHDNIDARRRKRGVYDIRVDRRIKYKTGSGSINGERLSEIHNVDGAGTGRITRAFMGLSKRAEEWMDKRIDRFVNEQLKKSKKKTIRGKT